MATIKRIFSTVATILNAQTLNDETEFLSSDVDLETDGYIGSQITVDVNFGTTPEYDAVASVYGGLDTTDYDDTPIFSQSIDKDTDPNQVSIIIQDLLHFKVGIKQSGTVTNDAVVTVKEQRWRYESS